MKINRLMVAIITLFVIVCLGVASVILFSAEKDEFISMLEDAKKLADEGELEKCYDVANSIYNKWLETEPYLSLIIGHTEFDDIGRCASEIAYHAKYGDISNFTALCNQLIYGLNHVYRQQVPSFSTLI